MSSSIFKWYTDIPDDAKEVAKVTQRVFTDELQEVIAHGIYPDLDGYWDDEDDCWYLWSIPDTEPNWKTHYDCIRLAGGTFEWIRPEPHNVNPTGQSSIRWHFTQG